MKMPPAIQPAAFLCLCGETMTYRLVAANGLASVPRIRLHSP